MRIFIILSRDGIHYIGSEEEVEIAFLCDDLEDAVEDHVTKVRFDEDDMGSFEVVVRKSDSVEPEIVQDVFRQIEAAGVKEES